MATRQELRDCLCELISKVAEERQTELALRREVSVPLSGMLAQARLTNLELSELLEEISDAEVLQDLVAESGWSGSRDEGEQALILKKA